MQSDEDRILYEISHNLSKVYDPEIPSVSVLHLGLIYNIEILETGYKITRS